MSAFVNSMHPLAPNPPPSGGLFAYTPKPPIQPYNTRRWYYTDGYTPSALTAPAHDEDFVAYRPVATSTDTLGAPQSAHLNMTRPVIGARATNARSEYAYLDQFLTARDIAGDAWSHPSQSRPGLLRYRYYRPCRVCAPVMNTVVGNGDAMRRYHPAFDPYMGTRM